MRPLKGHPTLVVNGTREQDWEDAEKVCQLRSRIVQTLNVSQRVRLSSSLAAALPAERCVLARRGWAGEKSGHFEHPVECAEWFFSRLLGLRG